MRTEFYVLLRNTDVTVGARGGGSGRTSARRAGHRWRVNFTGRPRKLGGDYLGVDVNVAAVSRR